MFRGKQIDTGKWIEGWLVKARVLKDGNYDRHIKFCIITYFPDMRENTIGVKRIIGNIVEVHPDSVAMQTGRLDKANKMIYGSIELDGKMTRGGDRVKTDSIYRLPPKDVRWIKNGCWNIVGYRYFELEIIGNQYDN